MFYFSIFGRRQRRRRVPRLLVAAFAVAQSIAAAAINATLAHGRQFVDDRRRHGTRKSSNLRTDHRNGFIIIFKKLIKSQKFHMDEQRMSKKLRLTIESIAFIAEHIKAEMSDKKVRDDWRFISMVVDRVLLLLFFGITLGGTIGILFSVPHVFELVDQQDILRRLSPIFELCQSDWAKRLPQGCYRNTKFNSVISSEVEERLIADLFRGYNHLIRPVPNVSSTPLEIRFSLALTLLINVDEKNQIMQTNVWPTMRWVDYQMQWNPLEYGNIRTIRVPPDKVWLPDIVLFNNADGNYEVSFYSNVVVEHNGEMLWVPPAIYKSSCIIDVEFFPFDEQICAMIFGSWTFNKDEVVISYLNNKRQAELNDYSESGIWDIMEVPGQLIHQKSKIAYQIRIRRKTLFYTVILIIPTVLMAFLSMLVFYLPAEADEKITLAISILLALVVFLLLVSKILPPTSDTIPLIAKYLLMTFVMNIITILVTVIIINIYFRGPTTHTMPEWVRTVFLRYLPLFLMMNRPRRDSLEDPVGINRPGAHKSRPSAKTKKRQSVGRNSINSFLATTEDGIELGERARSQRQLRFMPGQFIEMSHSRRERRVDHLRRRRMSQPAITPARFPTHRDLGSDLSDMLTDQALQALDAVEYITEHLRRDNLDKKIREQWKFVAMVIDRLLLYVFFGVTAGGTMGILFSAPNVFEYVNQTAVIEELKRTAEAEMNL
uniref:Uncharacterized protein n=1 Tax=Globodera rostochiensis TaxID=31243 RepID=A0A914GU36_GLORO